MYQSQKEISQSDQKQLSKHNYDRCRFKIATIAVYLEFYLTLFKSEDGLRS